MLSRVLEPEVMDTLSEAIDYDAMDHSTVNRLFVDDLFRLLRDTGGERFLPAGAATPADANPPQLRLLDVGTGTALIPIELCRRSPSMHVVAIDLAQHMLDVGQTNVSRAGLARQIQLERVDAKRLPFVDGEFPAVISNSIIHHIPEPLSALREMCRVLQTDGWLLVRDLLRPADRSALQHIVQTYAGDANAHQQQMFADSLHAALTLNEVRDLLQIVGLPPEWARQTSDRHWTIAGRRSTPEPA